MLTAGPPWVAKHHGWMYSQGVYYSGFIIIYKQNKHKNKVTNRPRQSSGSGWFPWEDVISGVLLFRFYHNKQTNKPTNKQTNKQIIKYHHFTRHGIHPDKYPYSPTFWANLDICRVHWMIYAQGEFYMGKFYIGEFYEGE